MREAAAPHLITNSAAGSGLLEVDATDLKVPMSVPTSEKKRNDVEGAFISISLLTPSIALTQKASDKPGKRRGLGPNRPKLDQTPWSAGFGINPHLFAGVCKAGRKKAPNSEELGV